MRCGRVAIKGLRKPSSPTDRLKFCTRSYASETIQVPFASATALPRTSALLTADAILHCHYNAAGPISFQGLPRVVTLILISALIHKGASVIIVITSCVGPLARNVGTRSMPEEQGHKRIHAHKQHAAALRSQYSAYCTKAESFVMLYMRGYVLYIMKLRTLFLQ